MNAKKKFLFILIFSIEIKGGSSLRQSPFLGLPIPIGREVAQVGFWQGYLLLGFENLCTPIHTFWVALSVVIFSLRSE